MTTRRDHPRAKAAAMLADKPNLSGLSLAELATEREKWIAACRGHGFDDETIDALADVVTKIEWAMIETPAVTMADILIKTRLAASFLMPGHGGDTLDAGSLRAVLADLERLAKGGAA